jgi:hypothetical protein
MKPFLKNFELLISLLKEKNIAYQIYGSDSLAPLLVFQFQSSNYKIQMELRDSLEYTIFENNTITNKIPIYNKTDNEILNHFENIIN